MRVASSIARSARAATAAAALAACGGAGAEAPAALQVGQRPEGAFRAWQEGETVPVLLNTNGGIDLLSVSLRAEGIEMAEAAGAQPEVTVTVDGVLLGALAGNLPDSVEPDGDGVLWNHTVGFRSRSCCHVCREADLQARVAAADGREFSGAVRLVLARGERAAGGFAPAGCPDVVVCCADANDCPDPSLTQVCQ